MDNRYNTFGDRMPALSFGKEMQGIDVSKWQKIIDFGKLKNEIDFCIVRAGFGVRSIDPFAHRNLELCNRAGIPSGIYWYAPEPLKNGHLVAIVNKLKDFCQIYKPSFPVFLDIEGKQTCTADEMAKMINRFAGLCFDKGLYPGVYGSDGVLFSAIKNKICNNDIALWVARYGERPPQNAQWDIWQYTSRGTKPGINGPVDLNVCRVDYPGIIKHRKFNGRR